VGISKCPAANCMCPVWVTRSRSLGWYSVLRNVAIVFARYTVGRGCSYRCVKNAGGVLVGCGRHCGVSPLWVGVAICIRVCGRLFIPIDGFMLPSCVEGFVAVNCFGWGFSSAGPLCIDAVFQRSLVQIPYFGVVQHL
jgi:hypothetical protein